MFDLGFTRGVSHSTVSSVSTCRGGRRMRSSTSWAETHRAEGNEDHNMNHTKQFIAIVIVALVASIAAFGQEDAQDDAREEARARGRGSVMEATVEAFGLTEDQVEQIHEIRRERPPRGQSREESQAWREEQRSKIQDLLTDEQRAKAAELEAAREQMRNYAGAVILGLTTAPGNRSGFGRDRGRGQRDSRRFRSGNRGRSRGGFRRGSRDRSGQRSRASRGKARSRGGRR